MFCLIDVFEMNNELIVNLLVSVIKGGIMCICIGMVIVWIYS